MKKVLIIGAGAMGAAFSFPLLDNNHKVTLTEPYNKKLTNQLLKKRKFHPSLKIILPKKLLIKKFSSQLLLCLLYTSPSPRDVEESRMPSSA